MRRIDAGIVREVLAEPCGLVLEGAGIADHLVNELGRDVSLVEWDPVDGALHHRQDVRRLMLADLTSEVPEAVVRTIHDRAVAFYEQLERTLRQEDATPPSRDQASYRATKAIVARAEEIYHRLKRGDAPAEVAKRWQPGVELYLRNALEELEPQARLWLSERLGVTPDERLLAQADLERWEEITARAVQRHLQSGDAQGALRRLRERRERSPASPLFRLELEALRMLGRKREALAVADKAVKSARRGGDAAVVRELLLQASLIEESRDQIEAALARVEEARQVPGALPEPEEGLRLLITRIRLLRKLGEARDAERRVAIDQAQQLLTAELVRSLHGRSALFREVVAELGVVMPNVLEQGIAALGLDLRVPGQIDALARGVTDWNSRLAASRGSGPGELAERAGVEANTPQTWKEYLGQLGRRQLSHTILNWHAELPADRGIDKTLVDCYRAAVDIGIHQS